MQVTIQTKLTDQSTIQFLEATGLYIGKLRAKLLKALLSGRQVRDLKRQYIAKHGLTARQFNSLASEVKGLIQSVKQLRDRNIKETGQRQTSLKKKIKALIKKIGEAKSESREGKKTVKENLRFQVHQKKRKQGKIAAAIERLKAKKISICLGSKKLFRRQFNLAANGYKNHEQWLKDFRNARSNRIFYLGSKDEKFGNQNCQLRGDRLYVRALPALEKKYGKYVEIPVKFKYREELIADAIKNEQAISYRFVRKEKDWYLFLTTERKTTKKVSRRCLGAIGVDVNKAHLAWAETDRHGNMIKFGKIQTPLQDRRSEQLTATLAEATKQIVQYARDREKPIVIEKLDFSKKKTTFDEKCTGYRRMLSYFAYAKFRDLIYSRAAREGVEVIEKAANFTSIIGKFKFALMYGISTHIAASLVLARRGLKLSERPPTKNALWLAVHRHRHVWALWR